MTNIILASFPLLLFVFLLVAGKVKLVYTSLATLAVSLGISVFFWKIQAAFLVRSLVKGFFVSFDIFFIIFGAILFLNILEKRKTIEGIIAYLESFSKDFRVQTIILAWLFEGFIEGIAGFGTPSALVAPVLIGMGFPAITAVSLSLLGNSTSVAFGAAGTPIRVGLAGLTSSQVPLLTSLFSCFGFLIPLFMLHEAVRGRPDSKKLFLNAIPFALFSGFVFVAFFIITSLLGQEFPSIIGSALSIITVIIFLKLKIFLPKEEQVLKESNKMDSQTSILRTVFPYLLFITLLISAKGALGNISITVIPSIGQKLSLFNPGFVFILSAVIMAWLWKLPTVELATNIKNSLKRTIDPFLVIFIMSVFVQILNSSGNNSSGWPSMLEVLASSFENRFLPFWSAFIGLFGSFLTGSATVSNIMFGSFLNRASLALNFAPAVILALATSGAAVGNMIALADIMTAETVVGIKNKEMAVVKRVALPSLFITLLIALAGTVFLNR